MKIFLLSQDVNNDYDTYDSVVVCAENAEKARYIHPDKREKDWDGKHAAYDGWCSAESVSVHYIGEAAEDMIAGVVLASFNAG